MISIQPNHNKRLKDVLIQQGLITFDQMHAAEEEKRRRPRLLGEVLVDLKLVTPQVLQETLSLVTGFPAIPLANEEVLHLR